MASHAISDHEHAERLEARFICLGPLDGKQTILVGSVLSCDPGVQTCSDRQLKETTLLALLRDV